MAKLDAIQRGSGCSTPGEGLGLGLGLGSPTVQKRFWRDREHQQIRCNQYAINVQFC